MLRTAVGVLLVVGCTLVGGSVQACPLCREAVSKTSDADVEDQFREAQAYNRSIYLMVAMPYLLVGGLGVAIYRHLRQRAQLEAALIAQLEGGSVPCHPSPGEVS